jgi:hypothetical protein
VEQREGGGWGWVGSGRGEGGGRGRVYRYVICNVWLSNRIWGCMYHLIVFCLL